MLRLPVMTQFMAPELLTSSFAVVWVLTYMQPKKTLSHCLAGRFGDVKTMSLTLELCLLRINRKVQSLWKRLWHLLSSSESVLDQ
jgi:hypothetical protein